MAATSATIHQDYTPYYYYFVIVYLSNIFVLEQAVGQEAWQLLL